MTQQSWPGLPPLAAPPHQVYGSPPPRGYPPPPGLYPPPPGHYGPPPGIATNGLPLADAGDRLVARILDTLVLMVPIMIFLVLCVGGGFAVAIALSNPTSQDPGLNGPAIIAIVVGFVLYFAFSAAASYHYSVRYLCEHAGQTIGKRNRGIRVVRADGGPLTVSDARRRWLAYEGVNYLGIFTPIGLVSGIYSYLDPLWLLWDKPNRQCLHDKYAKTVVVRVTP